MFELTVYENLAADQRESAAQELHEKIVGDANRVVFALCDLAEHLKIMRDCRLYEDLGLASFEEYVESRVGLKQRQAYNYISAYERLGPKVLRENGNLGITKLNLLAEVSAPDRTDFLEENDLAGMTVQQVKELVQKTKDQGEQLGLLQNALTEAKNREDGLQKLADSRREKIAELSRNLEEAKSSAEKLAKEKAAEQIAVIQVQAEQEKRKMMERAKREVAQIQASADAEIREANIFFTTWQEAHGKLMGKLREIAVHDPEKAGKLLELVANMAEKMAGEEL